MFSLSNELMVRDLERMVLGLCPDFIVCVLGQLAEAIGALLVSDVGANGIGARVLEVHDGTTDGRAIFIDHLTLRNAYARKIFFAQ